MDYYFAPMEGFTNYIYRRTHHRFFPGIDRYFTPFIATSQHLKLAARDRREIDPENNAGCRLVPQFLTKDAGQLIRAAEEMKLCGFHEMNLNLGCPSATVVPKGKGAGMLKNPDALDRFLDEFFRSPAAAEIRVSVKTRLGLADPEECHALLEIYNRYPFSELIIHPRTQKDFYGGAVRRDYFSEMYHSAKSPVVYNGDLLSAEECFRTAEAFPRLYALMIGRGLLINPALVREAKGGAELRKTEYRDFMEALYADYESEYHSAANSLAHLKDLWKFIRLAFEENKNGIRRILKSKTGSEYRLAADSFFTETELKSGSEMPQKAQPSPE